MLKSYPLFYQFTHGISISLRQLKRILQTGESLRRRQNYDDPAVVVGAVVRELQGSGIRTR